MFCHLHVHDARLHFCMQQKSYIICAGFWLWHCVSVLFFLQETSIEALQEEHENLKVEMEKLQSSLISREKVVRNVIIISM
jgi:hypothetical protein